MDYRRMIHDATVIKPSSANLFWETQIKQKYENWERAIKLKVLVSLASFRCIAQIIIFMCIMSWFEENAFANWHILTAKEGVNMYRNALLSESKCFDGA
jgi:hypothetical protein